MPYIWDFDIIDPVLEPGEYWEVFYKKYDDPVWTNKLTPNPTGQKVSINIPEDGVWQAQFTRYCGIDAISQPKTIQRSFGTSVGCCTPVILESFVWYSASKNQYMIYVYFNGCKDNAPSNGYTLKYKGPDGNYITVPNLTAINDDDISYYTPIPIGATLPTDGSIQANCGGTVGVEVPFNLVPSCNTPTGLTMTNFGSLDTTKLNISWDKADGVDSYEVIVYDGNDANPNVYGAYHAVTNNAFFQIDINPWPSGDVYVKVASICGNGGISGYAKGKAPEQYVGPAISPFGWWEANNIDYDNNLKPILDKSTNNSPLVPETSGRWVIGTDEHGAYVDFSNAPARSTSESSDSSNYTIFLVDKGGTISRGMGITDTDGNKMSLYYLLGFNGIRRTSPHPLNKATPNILGVKMYIINKSTGEFSLYTDNLDTPYDQVTGIENANLSAGDKRFHMGLGLPIITNSTPTIQTSNSYFRALIIYDRLLSPAEKKQTSDYLKKVCKL